MSTDWRKLTRVLIILSSAYLAAGPSSGAMACELAGAGTPRPIYESVVVVGSAKVSAPFSGKNLASCT